MLLKLINADLRSALDSVAAEIGSNADDLYWLIDAESSWNPAAVNPRSGAAGLIQFTNTTARGLGFTDAADLVAKYPSAIGQLLGPVRTYLLRYAPAGTQQALFLSVFYPAYRYIHPSQHFPLAVQDANPGIKTVQDYIDFVNRKRNRALLFASAGALVLVAVAGVLFFR
jgi:hypothetical protein